MCVFISLNEPFHLICYTKLLIEAFFLIFYLAPQNEPAILKFVFYAIRPLLGQLFKVPKFYFFGLVDLKKIINNYLIGKSITRNT